MFVAQFEQPLPPAARALTIAQEEGVVTVLNPAPAADAPDEMLRLSDYVTPNEAEARALTSVSVDGEEGARRVVGALRECGAGAVVITLGARGALYDGLRARCPCRVSDGDDWRGRRLQWCFRRYAHGARYAGRG